MTDKNNNTERNSERSPFHAEISEAGSRLAHEALEAMQSIKFQASPENPGFNVEIANMLQGFGFCDGNQQQGQNPDMPNVPGENPSMPNPSYDQSANPFNPGQPSDSSQQGPMNPLEQSLSNLLTQGQDANPAQQAAMGIGQDIGSGLMSAMQGLGDSDSGSSSDGSDASSGSNGSTDSDGSDSSDDSAAATQDDSDFAGMPAWMKQYAMSR
jgi:hypothetical protein